MTQKNSDSPLRRRAVNMVWTAAGAYDFDPLFLFFYQDGKPDFYMNSITGYVYKWMEPDVFFRLFDSTEGAEHQEMYDGLIWKAGSIKGRLPTGLSSPSSGLSMRKNFSPTTRIPPCSNGFPGTVLYI